MGEPKRSKTDQTVFKAYLDYLLGCKELDWKPVLYTDFERDFNLLERCNAALRKAQDYLVNERFDPYSLEPYSIGPLLDSIIWERERLEYLETAMSKGRGNGTDGSNGRDELEGGAGVTAKLGPRYPVLTGAGAKLHPYFDTEPPVRDP